MSLPTKAQLNNELKKLINKSANTPMNEDAYASAMSETIYNWLNPFFLRILDFIQSLSAIICDSLILFNRSIEFSGLFIRPSLI